jgi:hypothetical protein
MSINKNFEIRADVGQYEQYSKRWIENKIAEQETRERNGKAVTIPKELLVSKTELQDYYKHYDNIINKLKAQEKYSK